MTANLMNFSIRTPNLGIGTSLMNAGTAHAGFQSDSPGWAMQKAGRRLGEWLEYQLYQLQLPNPVAPDSSPVEPAWLIQIREIIFWLIVAALVAWGGWMLYRIVSPYMREMRSRQQSFQEQDSSPDHAQKAPSQWLQLAYDLKRQQRYSEACRAFYLAMLQQLQDKKIAPPHNSATDNDYRHWVSAFAKAEACDKLIETHEQIMFGGMVASEQTVNQCQQAYQEIVKP